MPDLLVTVELVLVGEKTVSDRRDLLERGGSAEGLGGEIQYLDMFV